MYLLVKVIPNAPRNRIEGMQDGILKVRIAAPADQGKANEELIAFLAEMLQIPKRHIRIVSGHSSRTKKLEIEGDVIPFIKNRPLA